MAEFWAFIKVIPGIVRLVESFVEWYVQTQIDSMKAEHREGIKKAIQDHDQRELEKAIGSPIAGEHSGIPGTVIVDGPLPGVREPSKD